MKGAFMTEVLDNVTHAVQRRYLRIASRQDTTVSDLHQFLTESLRLYCENRIFQKSGGRSGDLGCETMEYEVFIDGCENGWNEGVVQVYSVVDDSTNGYARHVTVIANLPIDSEKGRKLLAYLEGRDFVSSRKSFQERPFGSHAYRAYLDATPSLCLEECFGDSRQ